MLNKKYQQSLEERRIIQLKTIDDETYECILEKIEHNYILVSTFYDFEYNGITLFPKRSIKGYRDSSLEETYNRIIEFNKQIEHIGLPEYLKNKMSFQDVFITLKNKTIWPIIEAYSDDKESALFIGEIVDLYQGGFSINCYDAKGKWEDIYDIDFKNIYRVSVGDKYSLYFNAFMRSVDK